MSTQPNDNDRIFRVLCARSLQRDAEGFASTDEEIAAFEASHKPTPQENAQFSAKLDEVIEQAATVVATDAKSGSVPPSIAEPSTFKKPSRADDPAGLVEATHSAERRIPISKSKVLRLAAAISVAAALLVAVLYLSVGCPTVGRVDALSGAFTTSSGKAVALDERIPMGETYRLASGSQAKLTLADGSTLKLEGDTALRMEAVRHVVLDKGIAEADVASSSDSFVVDTPCATIRVVGTRFRVIASARQTTVEVSKGSVRVTNGQGSLKLSAGESALAIARAAPVKRVKKLAQKQREKKTTHSASKERPQSEEPKTADVDVTQAITQEDRVIITGSILDKQGNLISGAVIFGGLKRRGDWSWDTRSPTRGGTIMEDGSFTLDVTDFARANAKKIDVVASAYGYEVQSKAVDIEKTLKADFNLTPTSTIVSGIVVDQTGAPVAGVMLEECGYHYPDSLSFGGYNGLKQTITDGRGRFGMPGEYRGGRWDIRITSPMYAPQVVHEVAPNTSDLEIKLTHGGSIAGRVVHGLTGRPVQGARIAVSLWDRNAHGFVHGRAGVSAGDGRYVIRNLAPRRYHVRASTKKLFGPDRNDVIVQEGKVVTNTDFALMPGGKVSGRVYNAETGAPLPGMKVWFNAAGPLGQVTRTDKEGYYRFKHVPYGDIKVGMNLDKRSEYYAEFEDDIQMLTLEIRSKLEGIDFPLRKAATISGTIRDMDGQPVPKAKAVINTKGKGIFTQMSADDKGRFRIIGLKPKRSYLLYALADGFTRTPSKEVEAREGREYSGIDFVLLLHRGGSLRGRTVDVNGIAVARATVSLKTEDDSLAASLAAVSNDQGEFHFKDVPSGTFTVHAKTKHLRGKSEPVTLKEGVEMGPVEIVMESPGNGVVEGYVRDDLGNPVEGASVQVLWTDLGEALSDETDATGRYRIDNVPNGRMTLLARKLGYTESYNIVVCDNFADKDVTLKRKGSISGQVADLNGKPVREFRITADIYDADSYRQRSQDFKTWDGRFTMNDLFPGKLELEAVAKGYAIAKSDTIDLSPGDRLRGISFVVQPEGTIEGVVRTEDGAPIKGAYVCAETMPYSTKYIQSVRHVLTREDGSFTLGNFNEGAHTIAVMHNDHAPKVIDNIYVPYGAAAQEVEIILTPGARLTGTIYEGQEPVPNANVHLAREDAYKLWTSTTTDTEGVYTFDHLVPGNHLVGWSKRAGAVTVCRTQRTVEVAADETTTLDFVALGTSTARGSVTLDGKPIRCTVQISAPSDDSPYGYIILGASYTEADGSYAIPWLPSGQYSISASAFGAAFKGGIEIPEKAEMEYNIELQLSEP